MTNATPKESIRTAPWASDRALSRLAEVEHALPGDPAGAFENATERGVLPRAPCRA